MAHLRGGEPSSIESNSLEPNKKLLYFIIEKKLNKLFRSNVIMSKCKRAQKRVIELGENNERKSKTKQELLNKSQGPKKQML